VIANAFLALSFYDLPLLHLTLFTAGIFLAVWYVVMQGWQVSANSGLNRPGRNRFLPVFTKHGTTTAALRLC